MANKLIVVHLRRHVLSKSKGISVTLCVCVCVLSLELKIQNKTKNWGVFRTLTPELTHAYINPIFLQKLCQEKYYLLFTFQKSVLVVQNQSIPLD